MTAQLIITDELITKLKRLAERSLFTDDENCEFDPLSWSGGNFDDCFCQGQIAGETELAREILSELKISQNG